jgi:hypothetical protein
MPLKQYDEEGERWSVKVGVDLVLLELIGTVIIVLLLRGPEFPALSGESTYVGASSYAFSLRR